MEFTINELLSAFLYSILAGLCLAVAYEPFRIFHKLGFNKSVHYLVSDIFFMLLCGIVTYLYCIAALEGSVRMFVIVGEILGFAAFWLTARRVLDKIYDPIIKFFKIFFGNLLKICRKVMYNIKNRFNRLFMIFFDRLKVYRYERRKQSKTGNADKRSKAKKKKK